MSKLKQIVTSVGGVLGRFMALVFIFSLALGMLVISAITGATAESETEELVTHALPDRWEHLFGIPIPIVVALVVVALPTIVMGFLKEHAMNQLKTSWSQAKTQAWEYLLGRNQRRAGAVLWALLQLDLMVIFPFGVLGGLGGELGLPLQAKDIIRPEPEVRYIAQPITQRIQFEKAALRPDGGFEKAGSDLPGGAADMLQATVCELRSGAGCGASVALYGFASNEEFKGANNSHWKNLQVADHRAEAVHNALLSLPETKNGWLVVEPPKRWAPAIKPEDPQRPWEEMRSKRNARVQPGLTGDCPKADAEVQPGLTENCRNPDADRVVILQWTLDAPCEVPATAEKTEPNESG